MACKMCGRDGLLLHAMVDGNDCEFCDEVCIQVYSRMNPEKHITILEGYCEHGDAMYKPFFEKCGRCGNIRSVR